MCWFYDKPGRAVHLSVHVHYYSNNISSYNDARSIASDDENAGDDGNINDDGNASSDENASDHKKLAMTENLPAIEKRSLGYIETVQTV